jgi:hypothetical protein
VSATKNGLNGARQFITRVGFDDVSTRPFREGLSDNGRVVLNRNENERHLWMFNADVQGRSQTVEARHLDIAYDDVGHFQIHGSHQCSSVRHDMDVILWGKQRTKVQGHFRMVLS